jgi:hypothetical protein
LLALVVVLTSSTSIRAGQPPDSSAAIRRGVDWLVRQQAADGGWHSQTYGQLKGGAGTTALVLYALSQLPVDQRAPIQSTIDRALAFLLENLHPSGFVRAPDGSFDYPTYTTALTATAVARLAPDRYGMPLRRMTEYLRASQCGSNSGHTPSDTQFGGWDQTGGDPIDSPRAAAHLASTCFALEALAATDQLTPEIRSAALVFLARCQNVHPSGDSAHTGDGGFFFTPDPLDLLNKAGATDASSVSPRHARSYGTTTADGLVALLLCELPPQHARVRAARDWLLHNPFDGNVPGFAQADTPVAETSPTDAQALRYYYLAALARAASRDARLADRLPLAALQSQLVASQSPDGAWRNTVAHLREDDPLIATPWALIALLAID